MDDERYEPLDFNEGPDEKYRGGPSIEFFTERDMDRALRRFNTPIARHPNQRHSESFEWDGLYTTQFSTRNGFWNPRSSDD